MKKEVGKGLMMVLGGGSGLAGEGKSEDRTARKKGVVSFATAGLAPLRIEMRSVRNGTKNSDG